MSEDVKKRILFLRRMNARTSGWSIRDMANYCIEFNETAGRLLKRGNRPGYEEKFEEAEIWRQTLKEVEKRGILKNE